MVKKKYVMIGIILVFIISIMMIKITAGKTVEAKSYTVKKGDLSKYVEETATVKSRNERTVYAKETSEVEKVKVEVGNFVKKGDVLIKLDTKEMDLQIKILEAKLQGLKATYEEAIKPVDEERINQAKAKVYSEKINLQEAARKAQNNKKLYEEGVVSFDAYQNALNTLSLQEQGLKIAENELTLLQKGVTKNVKNQYEAQITELVYEINILKDKKEDYVIKAPIDGVIMEIYKEEGEYVQGGTEVLEIGDTRELYLESDILVSEIGDIKEGKTAIIYSEDLNFEGKGKVKKIYPKAFGKVSDLGIEQKRVKVEIDLIEKNIDLSNLKSGYELDAKIILWTKKNILFVPENAVFAYADGKYVFMIKNSKALLRKIETGLQGEERIEILSGLKEGEKVITSPSKDLEEGIKIKERAE